MITLVTAIVYGFLAIFVAAPLWLFTSMLPGDVFVLAVSGTIVFRAGAWIVKSLRYEVEMTRRSNDPSIPPSLYEPYERVS